MANPNGAARSRTLYPVDWIVIGYSLMMATTIALVGRPVNRYFDEILFYLSMSGLAALVIYYVDESAGRWRALLRILYPAFMFTFFYRVTGGQMFLLFDQFFDGQVVALEQAVLGDSPTLYFDRQLLNVWITEILSFCYFCYYLMIPTFVFWTFFRGDYRIVRQFLTAASLAFFVSYLLFWLYPVEGPRWYFAADYVNSVDGPVFRRLVSFVIDNGAVHGGAMPSSHTGVALVTVIFCFRYYRTAGWILAPIVTGLALGTVWGRFHYVTDTVLGAAIGILAAWAVFKYLDRSEGEADIDAKANKLRTQYVT